MATLALPVMAQEAYPSKPIHFVMPFPPSGSPVLGSSLQYVNTGKLAALAVTSAKRSPQLPNVPTLAEAGRVLTVLNPAPGIAPKMAASAARGRHAYSDHSRSS